MSSLRSLPSSDAGAAGTSLAEARGVTARAVSRGTHLVQLQLLPYDIVPVLLEPLQLPEARIGEELGQVGESASGWRPATP